MNPEKLIANPAQSDVRASLRRMGLLGEHEAAVLTPLAGGISSDIYRAELPGRTICVKRALAQLKVLADWKAPIERNHWEVEWMRVAGAIVPQAVPAVLGEDREMGVFAMAYLAPDRHSVWKELLRDGTIDAAVAAEVGRVLGCIHGTTADHAEIAARFRTDAIFYAIRLEPYLVATAKVHRDLASRFDDLLQLTRTTRRVLVHGDFSPKNILIGPHGPVIVDAECAWYGDPAFDLAFVLNHLLLKAAWQPQWRTRYREAFSALTDAYFTQVTWESADALEARTAALLPALMLARIDGKSPAEYLTADTIKDEVRCVARALLCERVDTFAPILTRWSAADLD